MSEFYRFCNYNFMNPKCHVTLSLILLHSLCFNHWKVEQSKTQKYIGLNPDKKQTFLYHANEKAKRYETSRSPSQTAILFTSNIFTDYLEVLYKISC